METKSRPADDQERKSLQTATFGLGCFWGPDASFGAMPGVVRTRVGYAGGSSPDPTYQDIGDHTEVVQVDFHPEACSFADLLTHFWEGHNPERAPYKRQYRSVILTHDEDQQAQALASSEREAERRGSPVSTKVESLDRFYVAEDYHQKYQLRRDKTLMSEFKARYPDAKAFREAPETALVNGFVAGHGSTQQLENYLSSASLSDSAKRHLRATHSR